MTTATDRATREATDAAAPGGATAPAASPAPMIRELKTLIAVAAAGTFAAAGDRIGLTQAAISAQMQRLEGILGFALFDRRGRTARLNPRGHEILARARELVRLHDELGAPRGAAVAPERVILGAIASIQRGRLPDAIAGYLHDRPQARIRVVPGVSKDLVDLVDAGELDLALMIEPPFGLQRDLRWTGLAREPYRLLVPRATADADWSALLASEAFIRYDHRSFGGRQVDRFLRERGLAVREVAELDELDAIVRLVANRVGVALVPEPSGQRRWGAGVRAVDLGAATFWRAIGLVHRPVAGLAPPVRALADRICAAWGVDFEPPQAGPG